jgi:hypothetical protein
MRRAGTLALPGALASNEANSGRTKYPHRPTIPAFQHSNPMLPYQTKPIRRASSACRSVLSVSPWSRFVPNEANRGEEVTRQQPVFPLFSAFFVLCGYHQFGFGRTPARREAPRLSASRRNALRTSTRREPQGRATSSVEAHHYRHGCAVPNEANRRWRVVQTKPMASGDARPTGTIAPNKANGKEPARTISAS